MSPPLFRDEQSKENSTMQPNTESSSDSSKQAEPKNTKSNSKIKSILLALTIIALATTLGSLFLGPIGAAIFGVLAAGALAPGLILELKHRNMDLRINETRNEHTPNQRNVNSTRPINGQTAARLSQGLRNVSNKKSSRTSKKSNTTETENPN